MNEIAGGTNLGWPAVRMSSRATGSARGCAVVMIVVA
jgi:hypothetical protein